MSIIYNELLIKFTVSMGLVSLLPDTSSNIESILKDVDQSLYLAKEKGRDCTITLNADY